LTFKRSGGQGGETILEHTYQILNDEHILPKLGVIKVLRLLLRKIIQLIKESPAHRANIFAGM
jgi:hypothetical protein